MEVNPTKTQSTRTYNDFSMPRFQQASNSAKTEQSSLSTCKDGQCKVKNCWDTFTCWLKKGWDWFLSLFTSCCNKNAERSDEKPQPKCVNPIELFMHNPEEALAAYNKDPRAFLKNLSDTFLNNTKEFIASNAILQKKPMPSNSKYISLYIVLCRQVSNLLKNNKFMNDDITIENLKNALSSDNADKRKQIATYITELNEELAQNAEKITAAQEIVTNSIIAELQQISYFDRSHQK